MRGSAVQLNDGIIRVEARRKAVKVGTVVMEEVHLKGKVRGIVTETNDKVIKPRAEVARWNRLRYVCSLGEYVDTQTGEPVRNARAVYMAGGNIYYLPTGNKFVYVD